MSNVLKEILRSEVTKTGETKWHIRSETPPVCLLTVEYTQVTYKKQQLILRHAYNPSEDTESWQIVTEVPPVTEGTRIARGTRL